MNPVDLYCDDLRRVRQFNREEERRLWEQMRGGDDEARRLLIESQLKWAMRCCSRYQGDPLYADLLQEASVRVIQCLDKFDPDRGRLSTLVAASLWRWLLRCCLSMRGPIHVPRAQGRYRHAEELERRASLRTHRPLDQADDADLEGREEDPAVIVARREDDEKAVRRSIDHLPCREREILRARLEGRTLKDIAARFGVSKERIRQLERRGMEAVRQELGLQRVA